MTESDRIKSVLHALANAREVVCNAEEALLRTVIDTDSDVPSGQGPPEYDVMSPILVSTEHSLEPWSTMPYSGPSVTFAMSITHGDGSGCVALFGGDTEEQAIANGDRTIACVNAMAGVSDPEKLVAAVRGMLAAHDAYMENDGPPCSLNPMFREIRSIAEALE